MNHRGSWLFCSGPLTQIIQKLASGKLHQFDLSMTIYSGEMADEYVDQNLIRCRLGREEFYDKKLFISNPSDRQTNKQK